MQMNSCMSFISHPHTRAGGTDTTAIALTFLLYYLVANRECWDRLSVDIRSNFNSPEEITYPALSKIIFLDALIHESDYLSGVF
jgi:cytochrome P450